ncbi:MAG: hypothetical protein CMF63_01755 [Magnetovibrio sp.]|jgi:hypothetical protein|nr:hypothetical protein [Magnetovibrio sp.]|tara:strand:+ start:1093 stop:1326 length:234 start_codon:yes stop_codon:yes gene_type:complete
MKKNQFCPTTQQTFIELLAKSGNVSTACRAVGITRQSAYRRRKADHDFAKAWDEAEEAFIAMISLIAAPRGETFKST